MAANRIYIQVDFQSQSANAAINSLNQNIKNIGTASSQATSQAQAGLKGFTFQLEQTGHEIQKVTAALAGLGAIRLGAEMVSVADDINRVRISFESMLGSGKQAELMMSQLRTLAAGQPFAFQDLAEGAVRLKAFGFAAKEIPGILKTIGNAAAALGGGKEKIDQILLAIGEMNAKDIVQGKEVFRQLTQAGIQVFPALQKALQEQTGKLYTPDEIRKLIEKGQLAGQAGARAILDGMQQTFGEGGSKVTLLPSAQFQKLLDEMKFLALDIVNDLAPAINTLLHGIKDLVTGFDKLDPWLRDTIAFMAIATPVVFGLGVAFAGLAKAIELVQGLQIVQGLSGIAAWGPRVVTVLGDIGAAAQLAFEARSISVFIGLLPALTAGLTAAGIAAGILAAAVGGIALIEWLNKPQDKSPAERQTFALQGQLAYVRQQYQSNVGKPVTPFAPLTGLTDEEMAKEITDLRKHLAMVDKLTDEQKEKLLKANEELAKHQAEIAEQAWDRAKSQLLGGMAAIEYRMAGLRREVAGNPAAMARVEQARVIEVQHQEDEYRKQALEERVKLEHKAAEEHISDVARTGALEVEAIRAVAAVTLEERAKVEAAVYNLQVENIGKVRDLRLAEIERTRSEQSATLIRQAGPSMPPADIMQRVGNINRTAADARVTVNLDADRDIATNTIEIQRAAADEIARLHDESRDTEREAQVKDLQRAGENAKLYLDSGVAQTEAQKVRLAQETAAVEIETARAVFEARSAFLAEDLANTQQAEQAKLDLMKLSDGDRQKMQEQLDTLKAAQTKQFYDQDAELAKDYIDSEQKYRLEATKKANEAIITEQRRVYDSVKSAFDKIWDAFTQKTTSVWAAIGNLLKSTMMTALKEIVTSRAAAAFTELIGGGHVSFAGGGWRGLVGQQPVFGGGKTLKAEQDNHIGDLQLVPSSVGGAAPVYIVNATELAQEQREQYHAGPLRSLGSPLAALAAVTAGMGGFSGAASRSPIEQVTSSFYTGAPSTFGGGSFYGGPGGTTGFAGDIAGYGGSSGGGSYGGGSSGGGALGGLGGIIGLGRTASGMGIPGATYTGLSPAASSVALAAGAGLLGAGLQPNRGAASSGLLSAGGGALMGVGAASMLGVTGLWGGVLGAGLGLGAAGLMKGGVAGLGMDVAGGALAGLQLGGPIGALIGAGVGALAGTIRLLVPGIDQQVRSKVKQIYGVDITEQNIRTQIATIAKNQYGGNLDVAIMSPEVQQIVRLYSLATGKNPSGIPRPMYAATFTQSGAGGTALQPVYQSNNIVANPYSGTTTTQYAQALSNAQYLQLDPTQALSLLTGQVTNIMNSNPGQVAAANTAAVSSGASQTAQAQALMEPLTVLR